MARLAWAALASALLSYGAGCTGRSIGSSDGGTDLAGVVDLASAGCELRSVGSCTADPRCQIAAGCCGGPSQCVLSGTQITCPRCPALCETLDEKTCLSDGRCRADYCQACACLPTFVGCHVRTRSPDPCPDYDCPQPACDCEGFDEAACKAAAPTRGCKPSYCGDCSGGQYFNQCLAPKSSGSVCPAVCPSNCRSDADCSAGLRCLAPNESAGCGACYQPDQTCVKDGECAAGFICEVAPCSCVSSLSCVPGCQTTSDCSDGLVCGSDHRCQPRACGPAAPCPANFSCQPSSTGDFCRRRSCTSDSGCLGGYCVKGLCQASLGRCVDPPS